MSFYDQLTGRCIREIRFNGSPKQSIYLTFDDGPTHFCTPDVLDLLMRFNVKATFFVIGNRAQSENELTKRMISEGHTIGNHTLDHDTKRYFSNEKAIEKWIMESRQILKDFNVIGFRSPVGIKTPTLNAVLKKLKVPLILWSVRFYDTKFGLTKKSVDKKLSAIKEGSIILLHDTHADTRKAEFLSSLEYLIIECQKKSLTFRALEENLVTQSYIEKYKAL